MKTKLQALIEEQKALTAKFEEMLKEPHSATEEFTTLDPKKVYIKGHPTRGAEVIKMLEDLGGVNRSNFYGNSTGGGYYIVGGNIFSADLSRFGSYTELHLPEEVSAENTQTTDVKVGDWIWVDNISGYSAEIQNKVYDNNPHQITHTESYYITININEKPVNIAIFDKDKFHKVDPPKEEVEQLKFITASDTIVGEIYTLLANNYRYIFIHNGFGLNCFKPLCIMRFDEQMEFLSIGGSLSGKFPIIESSKAEKDYILKALEFNGKHFDKKNMRLLDMEKWSCEKGLPIIVRNETTNWRVDILHSYDAVDVKYPFLCAINDDESRSYKHAIPYNKKNKHLIGTCHSPDKHYKFVEDGEL